MGWIRKQRTRLWLKDAWPAFRLGYITALDDIERTGLRPFADQTKGEAAKRALERLWDGEQ